MTRGWDRKELFLANKDAFSSIMPTLVAWIIEKSRRKSSDISTVLVATPVNDSREDTGTAMRDEDKALTIVLKFEQIFSTPS